MTISNEAIEKAHSAICEDNLDDCLDWRGRCVKAVEAAAPAIRAEAALEWADEFAPTVARSALIESPEAIVQATANRGRDWLRARAAAERGRQ